jgi:hypothetical protein
MSGQGAQLLAGNVKFGKTATKTGDNVREYQDDRRGQATRKMKGNFSPKNTFVFRQAPFAEQEPPPPRIPEEEDA